MKKLFFILLSVILINTKMYGQIKFDIAKFSLINPSNLSDGLKLNETTAKCVQLFGQPSTIANFYSEVKDETLKVYYYGSNKIYFSDSKLVGYEITSLGILVGEPNGLTIKIGDKITITTTQVRIDPGNPPRFQPVTTVSFHNFPLSNYVGKSRNMNFKSISNLTLTSNGNVIDSSIELLFNSNNELFNISLLD